MSQFYSVVIGIDYEGSNGTYIFLEEDAARQKYDELVGENDDAVSYDDRGTKKTIPRRPRHDSVTLAGPWNFGEDIDNPSERVIAYSNE